MQYVMSDIHGDFQNFIKMLKKINFSKNDVLYIIGDIFDKGTENIKLYNYIRDAENILLIKGNHEYLCERYIIGEITGEIWDSCGGVNSRKEVDCLTDQEKKELYLYLSQLPVYLKLEIFGKEYFLTHSGYNADFCIRDPKTGLVDIEKSVVAAVEQNQERYLFSDDIHYIPSSIHFNRMLIVGHYPTTMLEEFHRAEIYHGKKYIDIDTGNQNRSEGGRLACMCLDNWKEFYI